MRPRDWAVSVFGTIGLVLLLGSLSWAVLSLAFLIVGAASGDLAVDLLLSHVESILSALIGLFIWRQRERLASRVFSSRTLDSDAERGLGAATEEVATSPAGPGTIEALAIVCTCLVVYHGPAAVMSVASSLGAMAGCWETLTWIVHAVPMVAGVCLARRLFLEHRASSQHSSETFAQAAPEPMDAVRWAVLLVSGLAVGLVGAWLPRAVIGLANFAWGSISSFVMLATKGANSRWELSTVLPVISGLVVVGIGYWLWCTRHHVGGLWPGVLRQGVRTDVRQANSRWFTKRSSLVPTFNRSG